MAMYKIHKPSNCVIHHRQNRVYSKNHTVVYHLVPGTRKLLFRNFNNNSFGPHRPTSPFLSITKFQLREQVCNLLSMFRQFPPYSLDNRPAGCDPCTSIRHRRFHVCRRTAEIVLHPDNRSRTGEMQICGMNLTGRQEQGDSRRDLWERGRVEEKGEGCENMGVLDRKLHLQLRQQKIN